MKNEQTALDDYSERQTKIAASQLWCFSMVVVVPRGIDEHPLSETRSTSKIVSSGQAEALKLMHTPLV